MFGEYIADFVSQSWVLMALLFIVVVLVVAFLVALGIALSVSSIEAIQTLRIKK